MWSKKSRIFIALMASVVTITSITQGQGGTYPSNKAVTIEVAKTAQVSQGLNRLYPVVNFLSPTLPEGASDFELLVNGELVSLVEENGVFRSTKLIRLTDSVSIAWGTPSKSTPAPVLIREPLSVGQVAFAFDSAQMTSGAKKVIKALAQEIQSSGLKGVYLVGGADKPGTDSYNLNLSNTRTLRVLALLKQEIKALGLSDVKIETQFMGDIASSGLTQGRYAPDRVVKFFLYPVID
jgi:outer membrane protein OmpA-like peptidoglycan-associated protein